MSKPLLKPEQIAALETLRDRQFGNMSELHDSLPPGLQVCFSAEINQYKLIDTDSRLLVGWAFELNNLVDLSLDGMGYHRKPQQAKATIELLENLGLVVEVEPEVWRWADPLPDLAEIAKSIGQA